MERNNAYSGDKPAYSGDKPAYSGDKLADSGDKPADSGDKPADSSGGEVAAAPDLPPITGADLLAGAAAAKEAGVAVGPALAGSGLPDEEEMAAKDPSF